MTTMIAEIYGKVSSTNSNLTERLEDELTGNFFGNVRYISFNRGLKLILKNCIYPVELSRVLDGIYTEAWSDRISFWLREKEAEPDVLLNFDEISIIVEVKFLSGLSSDDDVDNSITNDRQKREESSNQLDREARLLERIAGDKPKLLILLAPEAFAYDIYANMKQRKLLGNVLFGYITWQKILDELSELETPNPFEKTIIGDLIALLKRKGFEQFRNFDMDNGMIDADMIWTFDGIASIKFSFSTERRVERGLFYEFGWEYL